MKGYKGFDKDMKCRDFQFEVGKTYEHDGAVKLCNSGFHFCENPLDIFNYYPPSGSKFAEIEAEEVSPETENDSKRCSKKITVKAQIDVSAIVKMSVSVFFERFGFFNKIKDQTATNAGDYGAANAGDCGAANAGYKGAANAGNYGAANAGDCGAANAGNCGAANAGDCGAANAGYKGAAISRFYGASKVGEEGIAVGFGKGAKASGGLGSALVLCEYDKNNKLKSVKSVMVDGKKIKADTFYTLKNRKITEA